MKKFIALAAVIALLTCMVPVLPEGSCGITIAAAEASPETSNSIPERLLQEKAGAYARQLEKLGELGITAGDPETGSAIPQEHDTAMPGAGNAVPDRIGERKAASSERLHDILQDWEKTGVPGAAEETKDITAEDITGYWVLSEVKAQGMTFTVSDLGVSYSFDIRDDGTFTMEANDAAMSGIWEIDGSTFVMAAEGEPQVFGFADGRIFADDGNGSIMYFERGEAPERPEPVPEPDPEPIPVLPETEPVTADEAIGRWISTEIEAGGTVYAAADLGEEVRITIREDGTFSTEAGEHGATGTWAIIEGDLVLTAYDQSEVLSLSEGRLFTTDEIGTVIYFRKDDTTEPEPEEDVLT
ncbi:MAG: lipocalin family protein, partial [Clostridia bacterium]|nr:lipocalin family protein [Clostridia bacterium]